MAVDTARVIALVDRQAATRQSIVDRLVAGLLRLWRQLGTDARYSDTDVRTFASAAASLSRASQQTVAGSTEAYLRLMLAELDVEPGRSKVVLPSQIRGVDPVEVYTRPVKEYRRLVADGLDQLDADTRALQRLELLGETDVALADRDTASRTLASVDRITGYRRIIHPEVSAGGTCGLCAAASGRAYGKAELMPLHARCACTVAPIVAGKADPGAALNAQSLAELYAAAGSTAAGDLAKVRYSVHPHSETGPTLTVAGQHWRTAADAAADAA
jgi:hypothetical protein